MTSEPHEVPRSVDGWRRQLILEYEPRTGWRLGNRRAVVEPPRPRTADGTGRIDLTQPGSDPPVRARVSTPRAGVLRLTVGEEVASAGASSGRAVRVTDRGGTLALRGPGVDATWDECGALAYGDLRITPTAGVLFDDLGLSGRLVVDGEAAGWVLALELSSGAELFGGGESFQGPRLRGRRRILMNDDALGPAGMDSAYLNVPFVWCTDGWGIWIDTGAPVGLDAGAVRADTARLLTREQTLDVYLFRGDPAEILAAYTDLTGRVGQFPDAALGVWMSRASYFTAGEVEQAVDDLERAGCPIDVVHVDAWQTGNVFRDFACNWTMDTDRFPDGWTANVAARGVGVSLWLNPYVTAGSPLARELHERGLLLRRVDGGPAEVTGGPRRHLLDFTNPAAVAWWRNRIEELVGIEGVVALKLDFAEEIPFDAVDHAGNPTWTLRNRYADLYQQATADVLDRLDARVALFCRSGTAGSQRHPCHWVGDTPSSWRGLDTALRGVLSMAASGFSLVGHDVGGFWTPGSRGRAAAWLDGREERLEADVEPELMVRWAQWGALSPVMRFHGMGRREPTAYPEPFATAVVEACQFRQELRPHLRDCLGASRETGIPMVRPMALADPEAPLDADLQYMLGDDILVAPLLAPGGSRSLWVPPGRWTPVVGGGSPLEGPGWRSVECGLFQFPAFRRYRPAGARATRGSRVEHSSVEHQGL